MKKICLILLLLLLHNFVFSQLNDGLEVHFKSDSFEIQEIEKIKLQTFLNNFSSDKFTYKIVITGHTDNEGSTKYNLILSKNRATEIAYSLEQNGFLKSQFILDAKGFNEPKTSNYTQDGKAINRRVSIQITKRIYPEKVIGNHTLKEDFYSVDTANDEIIKYKTGSVITIPKNSFEDKNGNPVTGKVDISYIEYRDPIDIVLSDISMNHKENSENVHLNSAGMNKILAFQNGKPVYLKKDSNITVDFPLAKNLENTNFYKYDSISRNWTEIKKLTPSISGLSKWIDSSTNFDTIKSSIYNTNYNLCAIDTCTRLKSLRIAGIEFATSDESIITRYNAETNYKKKTDSLNKIKLKKRFESLNNSIKMYERKIAANVPRITNYSTRIENSNPKYALKIILNSKDEFIFNIKFKVKNNVENIDFTNSNWQTNSLENQEKINNSIDKNYTFCEIIPSVENKYTITIKDSLNEIILNNISLLNVRNEEKNSNVKVAAMNKSYSDQLNRIKKFTGLKNKLVVKNQFSQDKINYYKNLIKAIDSTTTYPNRFNLNCFWNNSITFMSEKETQLSITDWLDYFEKNKATMQSRYEAITFSKECEKQFVENQRLQKIQDENQQKITTVYSNANELTKSLNISNLGIYNCDQIARLKNLIIINANYLNEKGETVLPVFIYLVDIELNGILKYDGNYGYSPYHFAYSESALNTLLAFDESGNSYLINNQDFVTMTSKIIDKNVTFFMKKIDKNENKETVLNLF